MGRIPPCICHSSWKKRRGAGKTEAQRRWARPGGGAAGPGKRRMHDGRGPPLRRRAAGAGSDAPAGATAGGAPACGRLALAAEAAALQKEGQCRAVSALSLHRPLSVEWVGFSRMQLAARLLRKKIVHVGARQAAVPALRARAQAPAGAAGPGGGGKNGAGCRAALGPSVRTRRLCTLQG
jgi:hypothetical protein